MEVAVVILICVFGGGWIANMEWSAWRDRNKNRLSEVHNVRVSYPEMEAFMRDCKVFMSPKVIEIKRPRKKRKVKPKAPKPIVARGVGSLMRTDITPAPTPPPVPGKLYGRANEMNGGGSAKPSYQDWQEAST